MAVAGKEGWVEAGRTTTRWRGRDEFPTGVAIKSPSRSLSVSQQKKAWCERGDSNPHRANPQDPESGVKPINHNKLQHRINHNNKIRMDL